MQPNFESTGIHLSHYIMFMKKILIVAVALFAGMQLFAQDNETKTTKKKDWSKVVLKNRAADHFMMQLGIDNWAGAPDSIKTKGLSRSFNMYFMFDFPFKSDPRFSVGIGGGIGTSNIYFDKQFVDVKANTTSLQFKDVSAQDHFKKFKLLTAYLEAPVELRFAFDPENIDKSWKLAIGGKVGTLVNAHTKGKTLQNKDGGTINNYTLKENSKRYFNGTKLAATFRVGKGNFSLFGQYQITTLIKEGFGPEIRPYSMGLTFSGL